jgi:hypothetical protein
MLFRIASHLGMTVRQLTDSASADELDEWRAFFELEPPDRAEWTRTAVIASTFANIQRIVAMGKAPAAVKIEDFMPSKVRPPRKVQTAAEQIAMLKALTRSAE